MYIDGTLVDSEVGVTSLKYVAMGDWWGSYAITNYFDDFTVLDTLP